MSHKARLRCVYRGGSYWRSLCCLAVFTSCLCPTAVLCCSSCTETLTGFSGQFTSPCYPVDYSPNLNCKWTILAPPGFIIQLTFHDFELEEAQGCQYDFVSIQNGAENIQFCGVTAKGHTLNSTTNEMVVTFKTDFSIQKKGFRASYRQVAVSLRNQKVVLDNPSQRQVVSVSPSVPIPDLEQFTVCLEAKSSTVKKNWILLSYVDSNNLPLIALRSQGSDILLAISNVECDVSQLWEDHFSGEAFTAIWQQLCVTWDSASGDIITQTQNKYQVNPCSASRGKSVAAQGSLTLAPEQKESSKTFTGELYNFRLWDFNMTGQMLVNLSCDEVGNVVDWENSFWDIPVSTLEADSDLSCASAIPTNPTVRPTCSSLGSGCQATTPVNSNTLTTNLHVTNSVDPSTDGISTPFAEVTTHGSRDTTDLRQQNNTVSQNTSCNCSSNEAGSFNVTDLQRSQVPLNHSQLNEIWQRFTSRRRQRSGKFSNPLGIISTPLRFPLRPRPSSLKPGRSNMKVALIAKTVTKSSRVTKDSKALAMAAGNVTERKHLPPSVFLNTARDTNTASEYANSDNVTGLTSEFISRLKKLMRQIWDLRFGVKNSADKVTEDDNEMSSVDLESHEALIDEGRDVGIDTLRLKPSISSILLPNQHDPGKWSSNVLNVLEMQPQTPFPELYQTMNPTPIESQQEISADIIMPHGHLLYGSLWAHSSNLMQLEDTLEHLGDKVITETSAQSLPGNTESSIDPQGTRFLSNHSNTNSFSTAFPEANSPLSTWPSSLLVPGQVGSTISSLLFERNNSVNETQLIHATELLRFANMGRVSMAATQRLFISTEQVANQLRQSHEFMLHPRQFSVRNQVDGTPGFAKDVDVSSPNASIRLNTKMNNPDALMFISSALMSDKQNISSIPNNLLDVSPRPSKFELNVGISQRQSKPRKFSMGSHESRINFFISSTMQSASSRTIELHPGLETRIELSRATVMTRVQESLLDFPSHNENSWRLSTRETSIPLLSVHKGIADKDYSQISLTGTTLHITQSHQPAPVMTKNKWEMSTIRNTRSFTKSTWVPLVALHTSSISTSDAPYLEDELLTLNTPNSRNESLTSDIPYPGNKSVSFDVPHPGNKSFTSDTPRGWNESFTATNPHPGNESFTSDAPHVGNESFTSVSPHSRNKWVTSDTPHKGSESFTHDSPHPRNESLTSNTLYQVNESLTSDTTNPGNESLTSDIPHPQKEASTFDTRQDKNDSLYSNGLHLRNDSLIVAGRLKSSLETSIASVWSSWDVLLDQRPEETISFQFLDDDAGIRSENTTLLHADHLPGLEQTPTVTTNLLHGSLSGTVFSSFSLTIPGAFQDHSDVIIGSYSLENFMTAITQRELELNLFASSPDRTDILKEETFGSRAILESSKHQQVMTLIPVDVSVKWPPHRTLTPSLSEGPQLLQSSDIFIGAESEIGQVSRSVHSSNDSLTLNMVSTDQKYAHTLQLHTSEFHVGERHSYNLGVQSFPLSEGISGMFSATSIGTQPSAGSQEPTLETTSPMDFSVVPSMSKPAWEIMSSTETYNQLPQSSQTSTTRLPNLQPSSSSDTVTPSPLLPLDVFGFNVTFDSSTDSGEQPTATDQASLPCLCEATIGMSCLCGVLIVNRGIFYRTQFSVYDQSSGNTDMGLLKQRVSAWLTTSFQDWNYTVYVESVSIFEGNATSAHRISARSLQKSYNCLAILYYNITKNIYLEERVVQERLINKSSVIGNNLSINSIHVQPIVNCTFEKNPQYTWTSTRPMSTLLLPCHTNPSQFASRKCVLNTQNYTSYWESPNMSNCSNSSNTSDFPPVSAENAAEVAFLLLDYSADKNLTREEVDLLLDTLNQIVIVAEINSSLASTVLTVLSNILSSSDTALTTSSQVALRTVDALTAKMIFDGPSVNISTPNLAIGISTIDAQTYNGTSFRLGSHNGESELEVTFDGKARTDSLAEVELPLSVLEKLTEEEANAVSRAQFAFFRRTGLFQDPRGFDLQSFVVASSLDNITISNLSEPVRIRIRHRNPQEAFKPLCAFWDLTLNNDSGGWNTQGCRVDPRSSANETICLCNHLTHFGILLDISGMAQKIDAVNTKILTFITHIGCGISAIFSATTLLTYVAFDKLRRDYPSKILMNLSTSLFFLNFIFLINGWIASFNIAGLCIAVAVLLHFFLLASFTWMGLEAVHMYIALVKVFNTYIRKYMLKFCIIGWGLPALVVLIVFSIRTDFYGVSVYGKDDTDSGSEFCWIEEKVVFYVTCVCYFAILFLMNISMFVVVLIQICGRNGKKSNRNLREEILRNLRSVTSLTFLLGMTWGFAFFAWGPVHLSFMYLFAIFNSIQGFFIFVFHCALKENVQKQWRRYLCCGRFRLSENSDWSRTITNTTKKVSSENLGKSLSSSSIGSNSTSWTSKFKSGSSLFKSSTKDGLFAAVRSSKFGHLDARQDPIVPIHNGLDKVSSYYPTHSDNFYKNIMMSENFSHSTKF
ncbi:adhesion G-protein coupled receptor G6 isoform X2 [Amblyraja radiata]|uniref:adhesion G-protein coupled receptor G6 isoform X2 n=1 Tax=Amblyraja radiata TaxID=386614 RepID=UPI00140208FF|nr:adhesion G-protein coupled receptor G6 isoform X2 [Amblyraja radiata]